jgi:3',5'-cyclic AMP phosphodiesterase CpdA
LATHPDTTNLILTGDLTHHGDPAEYAELKRILADYPVPTTYLVGNHDDRENFIAAFPDTPLANGFVQTSFDLDTHRVITLDSLDQSSTNPIPHSGFLCSTRLDWLDAQLDAAKGRDVLLFIHHPPVGIGFDAMDLIGLRNGDTLRAMIERHGNVKHLIAGHVHRTISGSIGTLSFSIFKSPCHQMPMIERSRDSSLSTNEPGAYGILFLRKGQVVVHSEDFEIAVDGSAAQHDPYSG